MRHARPQNHRGTPDLIATLSISCADLSVWVFRWRGVVGSNVSEAFRVDGRLGLEMNTAPVRSTLKGLVLDIRSSPDSTALFLGSKGTRPILAPVTVNVAISRE